MAGSTKLYKAALGITITRLNAPYTPNKRSEYLDFAIVDIRKLPVNMIELLYYIEHLY